MTAAVLAPIADEDIRRRLRRPAPSAGGWQNTTPGWQIETQRTGDWHLIERWTDDVGSMYGDLADGTAHISLYGHGELRIEIATYPQHSERDYDTLHVAQQRCIWTRELDQHGNDVGRDSEDIDYNDGETYFDTLDACQAEAARWGQQDESWWMRDGGVTEGRWVR